MDFFKKQYTEDVVGDMTNRGFSENLSNAYAWQYSPIVSKAKELFYFGNEKADPNYNVWDDIEGYESYKSEFVRATNKNHANFIKNEIRRSEKVRADLANTSWYYPSQLFAGVIDPLNITFALPIAGQFGLLAKGGMTAGQAFTAGARGGLAAGIAGEAVRAPFDPIATKQETLSILTASTILGGVIGSAPAVFRNYKPAAEDAITKMKETLTDKGDWVNNKYEDVTIKFVGTEDVADVSPDIPAATPDASIDLANSQVGDTVFVYDASGNRYQTTIVDKSEMGSVRVTDQDGEVVVLNTSASAVERNVNSPDDILMTANAGVQGSRVSDVVDLDDAISRVRAVYDETAGSGQGVERDAVMDLNALNSEKKRRASSKSETAPKPMPKKDLSGSAIKVNKKENVFEIDKDIVQAQYDTKSWSSQAVPEHIRLKPEEFQSKTEYQDFLIHTEKVKQEIKRKPGQSKESYEASINQEALSRTHSGYGKKKTAFVDSIWYKLISTPAKRILLNDKVADRIKRNYELINGNAAMAMDRNVYGRGVQSIIQRQPVHFMHGESFKRQLETIYSKEVEAGVWNGFGLNLNKVQSMVNNHISFDDWFKLRAGEYIRMSERWDRVDRYDSFTETQKESFELFRKFFERYDEEASALNLWKTEKTVDEEITRITKEVERKQEIIKDIDEQAAGRRAKAGMTGKQKLLADKLRQQIDRHNEDLNYYQALKANGLDRKSFYFPIYYNKQMIQDPLQRERFTAIIEEHITQNPKEFVWSAKDNKMIKRDPNVTNREIAEGIVRTILEETDVERLSVSGVGSKHTRMRTLDIPEWKVKDFILTDINIIDAYTRKTGNKIEWTRKFGKRTIDDLLDEIEEISYSEGKLTEKEVALLKRDFVADYEFSLGIHMREPDRWDAQTVKAIKEVASITYLHNAGIASVTDLGSIVFEHGLPDLASAIRTSESRTAVGLAKAEIEQIVKGSGYMLSAGRDRMFADSINKLQPNAVERVLNPITNVFYNIPLIGNNLGIVTRYGKIVDAILRQSKLAKMAQDIAANKRGADIEYWSRYGLDYDDAVRIASYADKFVVEDGFVFANRTEWPSATPAERELLLKWDTALNSGTGNTIMMATAKDKPIISRGVVYIPYHDWMKDVPFFSGLKPDSQISTANYKYARIESGAMTFPFQFMDFTLAATNRITAQMFDSSRKNRLIGAAALMSMGYLALDLKKPDWWFESKEKGELVARVFDHSGLPGIYMDLGYMALHMAMGMGGIDADNDWLRGKYKPTATDAWLEPFGAGPGLLVDWGKTVGDMLSDNPSKQSEQLKYLLPFNHITSMGYDFLTKD